MGSGPVPLSRCREVELGSLNPPAGWVLNFCHHSRSVRSDRAPFIDVAELQGRPSQADLVISMIGNGIFAVHESAAGTLPRK